MNEFSFDPNKDIEKPSEMHFLNGEDLSVAIGDFIRKYRSKITDERLTFNIGWRWNEEKAGTKDWVEVEVKIKPID